MRATSRFQRVLFAILIVLMLAFMVSCFARIAVGMFAVNGQPRLVSFLWNGSFDASWTNGGYPVGYLQDLVDYSPPTVLLIPEAGMRQVGYSLQNQGGYVRAPLIYAVAFAYLAFVSVRFRDWRRMKRFLAEGPACARGGRGRATDIADDVGGTGVRVRWFAFAGRRPERK